MKGRRINERTSIFNTIIMLGRKINKSLDLNLPLVSLIKFKFNYFSNLYKKLIL